MLCQFAFCVCFYLAPAQLGQREISLFFVEWYIMRYECIVHTHIYIYIYYMFAPICLFVIFIECITPCGGGFPSSFHIERQRISPFFNWLKLIGKWLRGLQSPCCCWQTSLGFGATIKKNMVIAIRGRDCAQIDANATANHHCCNTSIIR